MRVGKENEDEKGTLWESKRKRERESREKEKEEERRKGGTEMWMKCKQGMHTFTNI